MNLGTLADNLCSRFSNVRDGCEQIKRFDRAVESLPWAPFYEPVSIIDQDSKARAKQVNVDAPMLNAWAKHMSYSMRIRMRSFEPAVLNELLFGTSLVAATALRAHLEAAAMATLCLMRLNEARSKEGVQELASLIPLTLFGTALFSKAKKDDRVLEMLTMAEQQTITVSSAINALDDFTYGDAATGMINILYAMLTESAHPNPRGTRPFVHSQEVTPEGWAIAYSGSESVSPEVVLGIVDGLRLSMRGGYAATEMLRVAEFFDDPPPYRGSPLDEGHRIWSTFLAPGA